MKLFDTNVLIYAFERESTFYSWAKSALKQAILQREALVNPVVLAELGVGDENPLTLSVRLRGLGLSLIDLPWEASQAAAEAYARYLRNRSASGAGNVSKLPMPDFFIGAHASLINCPIVTVDVDRYRSYFPHVELIKP